MNNYKLNAYERDEVKTAYKAVINARNALLELYQFLDIDEETQHLSQLARDLKDLLDR